MRHSVREGGGGGQERVSFPDYEAMSWIKRWDTNRTGVCRVYSSIATR